MQALSIIPKLILRTAILCTDISLECMEYIKRNLELLKCLIEILESNYVDLNYVLTQAMTSVIITLDKSTNKVLNQVLE